MPRRFDVLVFAVGVGLAARIPFLAAQTVDASQATAGIAVGMIGEAGLRSVAGQPVASTTTAPDRCTLRRNLRRDITVSGQFTFLPIPRIGIIGEFAYLGLRPDDNCTVTEDDGDPSLRTACDSVRQTHVSASTTAVQGGLVIRPFTATVLQRYLLATAGVAFVPSSPTAFKSIYGHANNGQAGDTAALVLTIYQDPDWRPIRPSWVLAAGVATSACRDFARQPPH